MLLTTRTRLYVTSADGTSEMTFPDFCNAVKGGLKLDDVEVTTDPEHSKKLERKRLARREVQHLMANMTASQAERVVAMLRGTEDLMDLDDDYT
jgi:hypothetical protein